MTVKPRRPAVSPATPPLPRHHTAYLVLRQRLDSMTADALLPGEHELAADLGVSRITLRRALGRLEEEGRIRRRRGDGTRAVGPAAPRTAGEDTVAQLLRFGRRTATEVLSLVDVAAPEDVAAGLGLPAGATVRRAELRRLLGGAPVSHLAAYFGDTPGSRAISRAVLADRPLLTVTEEIGGRVREVTQAISAVLADAPLSGVLGVQPGAPLVRVVRRFLGRGGPLQYSVAHYRADLVSITTVERSQGGRRRAEVAIALGERDA